MPQLFGCAVCGTKIGGFDPAHDDETELWNSEFRGLYINSSNKVAITGIGFNRDGSGQYFAPRDSDNDYEQPGQALGTALPIPPNLQPLFLLINSRHGFIFHNACWHILQDAVPARLPSIDRLYEIFSSLPVYDNALFWGHDYGDPENRYPEALFPWDAAKMMYFPLASMEQSPMRGYFAAMARYDRPSDTCAYPVTRIHIPESQRLAEEDEEDLLYLNDAYLDEQEDGYSKLPSKGDFLGRLPLDVILDICEHLPMSDYLNARRASRAFWAPFHISTFWYDRFKRDADRGWMVQVRANPQSIPCGIRLLYRLSTEMRLDEHLINGKRIGELVNDIRPLLDLKWAKTGGTKPHTPRVPSQINQFGWQEHALIQDQNGREVWPYDRHQQFDTNSIVIHAAELKVPADLESITLSFCEVGGIEYVCGIVITPTADSMLEEVGTGYQSMIRAWFRFPPDVKLMGLGVALGAHGIRGLRFLYLTKSNGKCFHSEWLGGSGSDCLKSDRMTTEYGISTIKVNFDGFKMVSAGIVKEDAPRRVYPEKDARTFRRCAIWHPEVPGPNLHLNESSVWQPEQYTKDCNPLIWTSFGGPGGVRLPHLTGLHVYFHDWNTVSTNTDYRLFHYWGGPYIVGIAFSYDGKPPERGPGTTELGRYRDHPADHTDPWRIPDAEARRIETWEQTMPIDGPGGERITSITLHDTDPMIGLEVATNRNRTYVFGARRARFTDIKRLVSVDHRPGTTITGFYSHQKVETQFDRNRGLLFLGVISEVVDPKYR